MKHLGRRFLGFLGMVALLLAGHSCGQREESPAETLTAQGLLAPVEIMTDPWGVSHIYASNQHDLFFAQGYNAARDRLFQFEIWRRMATGTLSEVFGKRFLEQDKGARLLRLRVDIEEEMAHYHPQGREIIRAFVEGVNAYVDRALSRPEELPMEFRLLGIEPGPWTPEVVVSRHNGLFRNAGLEVELAQAVAKAGSEAVKEFAYFDPPDPELTAPEGIDLAVIKEEILGLYRASRRRPRFLPRDVVDPEARSQEPDPEARGAAAEWPLEFLSTAARQRELERGSNNWAITPERSSTGAAFLANDPHRSLQAPSLRYFVHLNAPGWNVIGGGEPALPGVSIGHNEHGAWGLTIFSVDQEDLYVYETHPEDPLRYRYGQGWEEMRVEEEVVPVKGQESRRVELKFTRHGPVLFEDPQNRRAYALRAAWLEKGTAPYLASLRMGQAKSWQEFRQACSYFLTPSENMLWADREGNIGWQATGITPRRPNWNGLLPVPGDGRYEWDGYLPVLDLPHDSNPSSGFLATANENNLPEGYRPLVGWRWAEPFRRQRLEEVLSGSQKLGLEQMRDLQLDYLSIPARQLTPLLLEAAGDSPSQADQSTPNWQRALEALKDWDYRMTADSQAAAVYALFERDLRARLAKSLYPELIKELGPPNLFQTLRWVTEPHPDLGANPVGARDRLLLSALSQALRELAKRMGDDFSQWRYGSPDLHHVQIAHPLSKALRRDLAEQFNHGVLPRGGSRHTVNMTTGNDNQTSGATFRIIADLSDWDASLATNSPGQSGDPSSPHYGDLFLPWANGEYFPLLFSRSQVEDRSQSKLLLTPRE
ncbi:MAG TPA: penicillin acylase family protein [Acidobacteriota bacterium]|nr:penicillin acylase family protein [Acidobacteriota bacterium]